MQHQHTSPIPALTALLAWSALSLLTGMLNSCAPKALPVIAPVPASIVTVTDSKPIIRAVERQTERLESRVSDASKKVSDISASVNQSVDAAIRSGDAAREAQAREFMRQVGELKSLTDIATATAGDLKEDSAAAHAELAKTATERDTAVLARETIRKQMVAAHEEAAVSLSRMDELRIAQDARAAWWKTRALYTWGALASIAAILVSLKIFGHI